MKRNAPGGGERLQGLRRKGSGRDPGWGRGGAAWEPA